jgi:predicted membrane protein
MKRKEVFWGLLLIIAAVLIILNQFGFFAGISMFELVVTVFLAGIIIKSIQWFNFWGILFPLAFLGIIYADELKITDFTPWPILVTALLLSIGLSLIFKKGHFGWTYHSDAGSSFGSSVINDQDDKVVNCTTSFGENIKYVNTDQFERANIKCSFGETKVYFDNAKIPSGKADIYLDVSFGEAVLYIPRTWKVVNDIHVFLGDADNRNNNVGAEAPVVTIHGNVSFGDAKIIYV